MIGRILFGLLLLAIGVITTLQYDRVYRTFGTVPWFEKYFGEGKSRFFYQLLGTVLALLGMIVMFNMHERFLINVVAPLFGGVVQQ